MYRSQTDRHHLLCLETPILYKAASEPETLTFSGQDPAAEQTVFFTIINANIVPYNTAIVNGKYNKPIIVFLKVLY